MTASSWNVIKRSNRFYINSYRKLGSLLFISMFINVMLIAGIYYYYVTRGEHDFYATNGETPPIQLTAMDAANKSQTALLPPDDSSETEMKELPE